MAEINDTEYFEEGALDRELKDSHLGLYMEELEEETEEADEGLLRALIMGSAAGDKSMRERLIRSQLKTVTDIARIYAGQGVELSDLIGEGNMALMLYVSSAGAKAVDEWQQEMTAAVIRAMEEYIGIENEEAESLRELMLVTKLVRDKAEKLSKEFMRKVSPDELSDSEISVSDIIRAASVSPEIGEYVAL